jgi:hypothetical protein
MPGGAVADGGRDRDDAEHRQRPRGDGDGNENGDEHAGRRRGGRRDGRRRRRRGDEADLDLDLDVDRAVVRFSVGVFLAFGLGTTVAYFLFGVLLPGPVETTTLPFAGGVAASLFFGIFLAPLLAVVTALTAAGPDRPLAVSTGVGAAAGFLAMVTLQFVLVVVLSGGGGGGGAGGLGGLLGQTLLPVLGFAVGVGLTGAATGYVRTAL